MLPGHDLISWGASQERLVPLIGELAEPSMDILHGCIVTLDVLLHSHAWDIVAWALCRAVWYIC